MKALRALWRLLRMLGHIAKGLAIVALRFPALSPDQQHARVQAWSMELLAKIGISLRLQGQPPWPARSCWWPTTSPGSTSP